jgi:signal recognition particle subunit SRP54
MTPYERSHPDIINKEKSRKKRIAKGSGNNIEEINRITKQFEQMCKVMHEFSKKNISSLMGGMPNMNNFRK